MNKYGIFIMGVSVVMQAGGAGHEAASARDPFQPLNGAFCAPAETFSGWRMRGVIGQNARWSGWLAQQAAGWRKINTGDVLPGAWRIVRLDKRGAELIAVGRSPQCGPALKSVRLSSPFLSGAGRP
ncbi:HofP DNA utilization family protein [Affinibrenneria salicis]|nr:HofP DNA utilization family protein [Affinibrenneria salicis]